MLTPNNVSIKNKKKCDKNLQNLKKKQKNEKNAKMKQWVKEI